VVQQSARVSAYRFPGLGDIEFVRDADGRDPLVMLASLAGKYLRELLMARVARYYLGADSDQPRPSGYHDPVTARFVRASAVLRKRRRVPGECFERERDADQVMLPAKNPPALGPGYKTS
ncbi:MAG TPA: hypothetical protein VGJ84_23470, partial [Polyangiaceae bacterium]